VHGYSHGMTEPARRPSRAERRRRTEERILAAARELFARLGFERTTIRAVAAKAEVDPALVMQYFGSKRDLFVTAAAAEDAPGLPGDPEALVEAWLEALKTKVSGLPAPQVAMMRSMLSHPEVAKIARETIDGQIREVSEVIGGGPEATARAALLISTVIGVTIAHQLLCVDTLRDVPAPRLAELLRPAMRTLVGIGPEADATTPGS
jgi:AcrR family transcriptional regulator